MSEALRSKKVFHAPSLHRKTHVPLHKHIRVRNLVCVTVPLGRVPAEGGQNRVLPSGIPENLADAKASASFPLLSFLLLLALLPLLLLQSHLSSPWLHSHGFRVASLSPYLYIHIYIGSGTPAIPNCMPVIPEYYDQHPTVATLDDFTGMSQCLPTL